MEEKGAGERNSADAQKNESLHSTYYRYTGGQGTPLRATVGSGFLSARYSIRIVTCAPVEYLTYGIRNIFNLIRRIRRRGGRLCPPDRAKGALRMRHTPRGCCLPAAPEARNTSAIAPQCHFYSDTVTVPSATISFPSCGKRYGRKGRWERNSAYARKGVSFRFMFFRYPGGQGTPFGRP